MDVKLANTAAERERYDLEADIYSLLLASESLEKLYIRDLVSAEEYLTLFEAHSLLCRYTAACQKMIAQFKTSMNALDRSAFDLSRFMAEYEVSCPAAFHRLYEVGVPATTEHVQVASGGTSRGAEGKHVAQIVTGFVTLLDALRLNMTAVDQLHPILSDLLRSINRYPDLPGTFQGKEVIKRWLITLNKMKAAEVLDDAGIRQLTFDIESANTEFYRLISDK